MEMFGYLLSVVNTSVVKITLCNIPPSVSLHKQSIINVGKRTIGAN